jgi:hypothetical protein
MSGRVHVHDDQERTAEEVIAELLDAALATAGADRATSPSPTQHDADSPLTPAALAGD